MSEALLDVRGLTAGYGDAVVLDDIGFSIPAGGSLAVLGRNGTGKSTLMLTLMGHTRHRAGTIRFRGTEIAGAPPHRRARLGLGWVPQEREVFPSLTVDEHLIVGAKKGPWTRQRVFQFFPRLEERRRNMGNQLSGGEQQMLAIARALIANPTLILLDEPLEGLAPVVVAEVAEAIRRMMQEEGLSIVLVEQHAEFALRLTDRAIILDRGRLVHEGPSAALLESNDLIDRYVGVRVIEAS
ncbi:MAG: transporter ATP-binding protein [Rhodospirillales bacterium]|nr:transporter ATP-binding protein [Rhodospirillales bacterium]